MTLLKRSLTYYWRTHLALIWGVATAVAVLAGALLVGESVRESLRSLFLGRLGNVEYVVSGLDFFAEDLADDIQAHEDFRGTFRETGPLIVLEGFVIHEKSGRRSSRVQVYGIDERFWAFHGLEPSSPAPPSGRDAVLTKRLALELNSTPGDTILLRVERPYDVPGEFLHGRREQKGRTIRLKASEGLPSSGVKEFALYPQQGTVRALFVPLDRLQRDLDQEGRVNTLLVSGHDDTTASTDRDAVLARILKESFRLADVGIKLRALEAAHSLSLESGQILISDALETAAQQAASGLGLDTSFIYTYLANSIRSGPAEIPYSLVSAVDPEALDSLQEGLERLPLPEGSTERPIVINDWAARDLGVRLGDPLTLEYYFWEDEGRLETRNADFQIVGIVPIEGAAGDPDLAPTYPGITGSDALSDWEPPFPIDLDRIRDRDEEYWDLYRTTPKAFIPLAVGQRLWQSRYGALTSIRIFPEVGVEDLASTLDSFKTRLRETIDPIQSGLSIYPARAQGLRASRGATDFGEYFVYFSFFLVVSALLLTGLFFRLGVEQRLPEIGILFALGFTAAKIRRLFLSEGLVLAAMGSLIGVVGAVAYAELIMFGLRTWWVDAVGTQLLTLHASTKWLALGGLGGILAAILGIAWMLRSVKLLTPRSLLTGTALDTATAPGKRLKALLLSVGSAVAASALLIGAWSGSLSQVAGFFGAGTLLLVASLAYLWTRLASSGGDLLVGTGSWAVSRLGFRNASYRPGRSLLCVALIAFATFIIVAVDAFRRDDRQASSDPQSGTGGFSLLAESLLPLIWDLNTVEGKESLGIDGEPSLANVRFFALRVRPGEDASCLNLYRPQNPRILAPSRELLESARFAFAGTLADSQEEKDNPWLLLDREETDRAIPVIGDANSMTYVLHLKLGEDFLLERAGEEPRRLRLVAMLKDSVFQGELLMSERNFLRAFPDQEGFRFFLLDVPPNQTERVTETLEQVLSDFGFDVAGTAERLAGFRRVENAYLSTFQTLGGLGLVLGTLGLGAVLLRNVLERRRELALLRAIGYDSRDFSLMVLSENAVMLFWGLAIGTLCALVAIAPALVSRGGGFSLPSLVLLLLAVLASGVIASLLAVAASVRSPLLESLRAE